MNKPAVLGIMPRAITGLAMLLGSLLMPSAGGGTEESSLEYAVKGAYLYKFGAFVTWPDSVFETPTSPIDLCIAGPDPFGEALDKAVSGQKIDGRDIEIKRLDSVTPDVACHILYIGGMAKPDVAATLAMVRGRPILTASDENGFPAGAVINFVIQNNRVRFEIDDRAAAENGLTISSRLLVLALSVTPRS